jgi:hypothetical protein
MSMHNGKARLLVTSSAPLRQVSSLPNKSSYVRSLTISKLADCAQVILPIRHHRIEHPLPRPAGEKVKKAIHRSTIEQGYV